MQIRMVRLKHLVTKERNKRTNRGQVITRPVSSSIGFVGKQTEGTSRFLPGGGTQVQFDENIKGMSRNSIIKPVSQPKLLN
jgi:hypothetical protein